MKGHNYGNCKKCKKLHINPFKNKHHSKKTKDIIGKNNIGRKNGMWKGDNVGYGKLHAWLIRHNKKPKLCKKCKKNKPLDLANKTGIYDRNIENYEWLCRRCHMLDDGRMNNLKQFKNNKKLRNFAGLEK